MIRKFGFSYFNFNAPGTPLVETVDPGTTPPTTPPAPQRHKTVISQMPRVYSPIYYGAQPAILVPSVPLVTTSDIAGNSATTAPDSTSGINTATGWMALSTPQKVILIAAVGALGLAFFKTKGNS